MRYAVESPKGQKKKQSPVEKHKDKTQNAQN